MGKRKRFDRSIQQTTVESLSHDGRGISQNEGKKTFILGALPGETVSYQPLKRAKGITSAVVKEIHEPSPKRIKPTCPHFTACGGCQLQHLSQAEQVAHKHFVLQEQFKHIGQMEAETWAEPLVGPSYGYRRRARLSVKHVPQKGKVLVGFRELDGRFVSDNSTCPVLTPPFNALLTPLSDLIGQLSQPDKIPQIELTQAEPQSTLLIRHLTELSDNDRSLLTDFAEQHGVCVLLQPKGYDSITDLAGERSEAELSYQLDGLTYFFRPEQFIQVNAVINERMMEQALEWLNPQANERILDLFCGIGNISLPLAKRAKWVTGVEGELSSVKQAAKNAKHNNLSNTAFFAENLFEDCSKALWAMEHYDALVIDPPRAGAKEIVENVGAFNPTRILYISCHSATLARDAGILQSHGYTLKKAGMMDMFPQTQHMEAMALFAKE